MNAVKQAKKNKKSSKVRKNQIQRSVAFAYLKGIDEVKYIVAQYLEQGSVQELLDILKMKKEEDGTYSTDRMTGYDRDHKFAPPTKP